MDGSNANPYGMKTSCRNDEAYAVEHGALPGRTP